MTEFPYDPTSINNYVYTFKLPELSVQNLDEVTRLEIYQYNSQGKLVDDEIVRGGIDYALNRLGNLVRLLKYVTAID